MYKWLPFLGLLTQTYAVCPQTWWQSSKWMWLWWPWQPPAPGTPDSSLSWAQAGGNCGHPGIRGFGLHLWPPSPSNNPLNPSFCLSVVISHFPSRSLWSPSHCWSPSSGHFHIGIILSNSLLQWLPPPYIHPLISAHVLPIPLYLSTEEPLP